MITLLIMKKQMKIKLNSDNDFSLKKKKTTTT